MTNYEKRKRRRELNEREAAVVARAAARTTPELEAAADEQRSALLSAIKHSKLSAARIDEVLTVEAVKGADERAAIAEKLKASGGTRRCTTVGLVKVGMYYSALQVELDLEPDGSVRIVSLTAKEPTVKASALGQLNQAVHKEFVRK